VNPERHPALALRPDQRRLLTERLLMLARPVGWRGWLTPARRQPSGGVLVLAAGLLLTARTSLSRTLVTRIVGRGRRPVDVHAALAWLEAVGLLAAAPSRPDVLVPTPAALALLEVLEVPPLPRRRHDDLAVPGHLASLLASGPVAPPSLPAPAPTEPDKPAVPAARPSRRRVWLGAGLTGLVGLGALWGWHLSHPTTRDMHPTWAFRLERLASRGGTLLQLDQAGMLLSLQDGTLYSSAPDRLDFKRAVQFEGFDMAADCSLVAPRVARAVPAPGRRFLWVELAGARAPERCLVDLETRTVTHDAGRSLALPPAQGVVGWLSGSELALAESPSPRWGAWHVVDVTTRGSRVVPAPEGQFLLRIETPGGVAQRGALAWLASEGTWRLALDEWREGTGFVPGERASLRGFVPSPEAVPQAGALSGDGRLALLTWLLPATEAQVVTLTTLPQGETVAVPLPAPLVPDAPTFWEPGGGSEQGQRFFATLSGPHGPEPVAIVASARRQAP
jgi:hypothetical protein